MSSLHNVKYTTSGNPDFLRQLQASLQTHLLHDDQAIANYITGDSPEMVSERLGIYQHAYYGRLLEVLGKYYEPLVKFLGDDKFYEMAEAYVKAYPSKYFTVDLFPQHLPQFLATAKPYADKPYLTELATFIWSVNSAIDAPDGSILKTEKVGTIPQEDWADMHFTLHPSTKLFTFAWNVVPIWLAALQNTEIPATEQTTCHAVIWRKGIQPYYYPLNQQDFWVLQALQEGKSFGEVCNGLLQWFPEDQVATHAVSLLLRWLNDEMFSDVEVKRI